MNGQSQYKKNWGRCAFCSYHGKLSREHIFPKWSHNILELPYADSKHVHSVTQYKSVSQGFGTIRKFRNTASGDPGSKSRYIVCEKCNNGWMSKLQEQAKPCLTKLILGEWCNISENLEAIVKWCIMSAMVIEHNDRKTTVTVSQDERECFQLGSRLLNDWVIWVGRTELVKESRNSLHRSYAIEVDGELAAKAPMFQAITIVFGKLMVQITTVPFENSGAVMEYAEVNKMRVIHPVVSPLIDVLPELPQISSLFYRQEMLIGLVADNVTKVFDSFFESWIDENEPGAS